MAIYHSLCKELKASVINSSKAVSVAQELRIEGHILIYRFSLDCLYISNGLFCSLFINCVHRNSYRHNNCVMNYFATEWVSFPRAVNHMNTVNNNPLLDFRPTSVSLKNIINHLWWCSTSFSG